MAKKASLKNAVAKIESHPIRSAIVYTVFIFSVVVTLYETFRIPPLKDRIESLESRLAHIDNTDVECGSLVRSPHEILDSSDANRKYISQRPSELFCRASAMTSRQRDLDQKYKDRWIRITGPLGDFDSTGEAAIILMIVDGVPTRMVISNEQVPKLDPLEKNEVITIEGKYLRIDDKAITFTDSRVLSPLS